MTLEDVKRAIEIAEGNYINHINYNSVIRIDGIDVNIMYCGQKMVV